MTNQRLVCGSCKSITTNIEGSTVFKCPNCGKTDIVRCKHCRSIAAKYKCASCGFEGPN
ncbi:MAG: RNA-binding protein [Nanoarchaeota archaeon]|nr:RNA-binding protein [Nanoarchaeota archaeon]MBU1005756.1 RNA-binding protein [Nanoarchaeota archaeon]MBU1946627.1 RNA-binding protein [Nanoarchaeota archaeon]